MIPPATWIDPPSGVLRTESMSESVEPGISVPGIDRITGLFRAAAGFLNRRALARATRALPRTLHYIGSALLSGEVSDSVPAPHLSLGLAAQVAMDEALLAMAMTPRRFPLPGDYARVSSELAEAESLYAREGWIAEPDSYHRTPPPLFESDVTTSRGWAMGLGYDRWDWDSGFTPHPGEPGADRWMAFEPNRTASAVIVRHPDGPRPWVIAVHGFCMGFPFMDFQGLQMNRLHHELGMNVALPALPLHGPRRVTLVSGEPFLSFELMNAVHGLTQAVWDIRRLITLIRRARSHVDQPLRRLTGRVRRFAPCRSGRRASTAWWRASRYRISQACSTGTVPTTSVPDRSSTRSWAARPRTSTEWCRRCPSRPRCPSAAGSSSPATATGWPFRIRPNVSGSTGISPASRGIRGATWATCGPNR